MNDNAKLWVETLRSGKYEQAHGALYDGEGYCCLGVGCRLYGEAHGIDFRPSNDGSSYLFMRQEAYLPDPVREWLGLQSSQGWFDRDGGFPLSLAGRNDSGASFEMIADTIESEPEGLFVEDAE